MRDGHLDVLARITALAAGKVQVSYRSSGVTTRFSAPIAQGTVRFKRLLPRAQRRKTMGIFMLTYGGSARVHGDRVSLRAAPRSARLARSAALIDDQGRLRVAGTITPLARGVVRIRLAYVSGADTQRFLDYRAKIAVGKWSLTEALPKAIAAGGGQLSIQYTGYEPRRIRGEQVATAVAPPPG